MTGASASPSAFHLKDALISTGFPFRPGDNFANYLTMMGDVMQRTAGLRRPGAAALDLAYVAAGFTEGFLKQACSPGMWRQVRCWSLKPVAWLATLPVKPIFWTSRNAWRATPRIYGQLIPILGKYSKFASAGEKAALRQNRHVQNHESPPQDPAFDAEPAPPQADQAG
jgi:myo-inositol-1(or 4)-monophosphatase